MVEYAAGAAAAYAGEAGPGALGARGERRLGDVQPPAAAAARDEQRPPALRLDLETFELVSAMDVKRTDPGGRHAPDRMTLETVIVVDADLHVHGGFSIAGRPAR